MRKSPVAAAVVTVTVLLSGCAGTPTAYTPKPGDSFALSATKALGFFNKLKDVPKEDGQAMEKILTTGGAAGEVLDAGFIATQVLAPPPGFSPIGAGILGFFSVLASSSDAPESHSLIFGWVPKKVAGSAEEATAAFNAAIVPAARSTFSRTDFGELAAVADPRVESSACLPISGCTNYQSFRFTMTGGKCAEAKDQVCQVSFGASSVPKDELVAPTFLGGEPAWRLGQGVVPMVRGDDFLRTYYAAVDELTFYKDLSRQLPPWIFIYLAPKKAAYRDAGGALKLLPYPVVIHQGTVHYFVAGAS